MTGVVTRATVECDGKVNGKRCSSWVEHTTVASARKQAASRGWKWGGRYDLCPSCVERIGLAGATS